IVGEQNVGGLIQMTGARSCLLERISVHDLGSGTVTSNMIDITTSPGGATGDQVTIIDYVRTQGEMDTNAHDIHINSGGTATLIGCATGLSAVTGFKLNVASGSSVTVLNSPGTYAGSGTVRSFLTPLVTSIAHDVPSLA